MSIAAATVPDQRSARLTLRSLRRTRQRRRLGDVEWYDVAYRAYLFGLVGLTVVVWLSDAVDGWIGDEIDVDDLLTRGPAVIGLVIVGAFALGLRSGADGGPVSIELADIRHVLLAPIGRRSVMLRPVGQRLRSAAFTLGLAGAILGQLIATEVEGSRAAWAAACGAYGAMVGATFVATAVVAHAVRLPRWSASAIAAVVVAWQLAVAWGVWHDTSEGVARVGPGNLAGHLALWGVEQRPLDLAAVAVVVALCAVALVLGGRLRIEALSRRGELVSQLRFAATMQDLRTVVQLRRQLRSEGLRSRPWFGRRRSGRPAAATPRGRVRRDTTSRPRATDVWRRDARSLRRLPVSRLTRIALLAVAGGVGAALTIESSPLFGLVLLVALFLAGLESLEPLSQEIDRPDITDSLPIDRGWVYLHHLVAPAVLLVAVGVVGAVAAAVVEPALALGAVAVAVPVVWVGALGGVVVTVSDAPTAPTSTNLFGQPRNAETGFTPPEYAGFGMVVKMLVPIVVSAVGTVPVFVARIGTPADVGRAAGGILLFAAAVTWWVRRRDAWGTALRAFMEEGRAART